MTLWGGGWFTRCKKGRILFVCPLLFRASLQNGESISVARLDSSGRALWCLIGTRREEGKVDLRSHPRGHSGGWVHLAAESFSRTSGVSQLDHWAHYTSLWNHPEGAAHVRSAQANPSEMGYPWCQAHSLYSRTWPITDIEGVYSS